MASTRTAAQTARLTICVSHIPDETSEHEVAALFEPYGPVYGLRLIADAPQCRFQKAGYVDVDAASASDVIAALNGYLLNGSILRAEQVSAPPPPSKKPAPTPPAVDETPSTRLRCSYVLDSIEPTEMPEAGQPGDWYRYVLVSGRASIVGYRCGTRDEVIAFAESCAEDLNLRNTIGYKSPPRKTGASRATSAPSGWN